MTVITLTNATIRRHSLAYIFTASVRLLLALAFIPSGLATLLGNRFTTVGPESPVGYFFDALYQTGAYYQFIGGTQLLAALLLLIPATATLGALAYFVIALNIFVITVSLPFSGTPAITFLMLMGSIWLLIWDYRTWRALLPTCLLPATMDIRSAIWGMIVGAAAGAGSSIFLSALQVSEISTLGWNGFLMFTVGGTVFGLIATFHYRHLKNDEPV